MQFDFNQSHFDLFGLPPQFVLDSLALDAAYRALQVQYHPDRFASADDSARRMALQITTRVNEAYQTLKSPLARGRYLLSLSGVDTQEETNTAMPVDFLMQQMEWREAVADAKLARDDGALDALAEEVGEARLALEAKLGALIDGGGLPEEAAMSVRKLRFLEKLEHEIGDAIEALLF
ncbi:Fe-S protein assembly co-chaperone HscB [Chitinibacteraceae bacterium HSL-7]